MKSEENHGESSSSAEIWKDPRFSHLVNDPRFRNISESKRKVKIDKRFQSMFKDPKFSLKYTVDKYGRRVEKVSSEELKKFYALSDEEEEDEQDKEEKESAEESDENDQLIGGKIGKKLKNRLKDLEIDYARGEANILTDSSSDDESSSDEDGEEIVFEHVWGELDRDAPRTDESTKRLAACNMDWDKMRAVDILVLCSSFLPEDGRIVRVSIYPSEFGKERMKEEDMKGPTELLSSAIPDNGLEAKISKENDEEGDSYHMEKLREYQLNRLKYFYAVIECDCVRTADHLYAECDGLEYESSATKLDFRFIPDDMTFDDEPHDVCEKIPNLKEYQPRVFETTALQSAKVKLTWDDTSEDRKEFNEKVALGKISELPQEDLKKFIAYSSDEDEDDFNKVREDSRDHESDDSDLVDSKKSSLEKYKNLLSEIKDKEDRAKNEKVEREFSWGIMVGKDNNEQMNENSSDEDKMESLTPFERLLEKKKRKQKQRKEEIKQKIAGDSNSDDDSSDGIPEGIDMNDPYFAEEFAGGNFAPPKNTKKKQKEKRDREAEEKAAQEEEAKTNAELALLLDDREQGKSHFSLKKIQSSEVESKKRRRKKLLKKSKTEIAEAKAKKSQEDDFKINVEDKRFSAIFNSHLFNIDPTDPNYKKTKAMETLIEEKIKRKNDNQEEDDSEKTLKKVKKDAELSVLVKSIKRKVKNK